MKIKLLCSMCLLLVGFGADAQNITVTGKVRSSDDQSALPGVNIVEKGTQNGTITDGNGGFTINAPSTSVLVFSFVGFSSQEVSVQNRGTIDVSLKTDITTLSEIVVIGYGQQEKKDVTGSVATVGIRDFNRGVISSPQDMMLGKVAGVQITSNNGAPGSGASIRIRGTGSVNGNQDPLIVIDGFPVDNRNIDGLANPLASINPNDIETWTVLKDASATAIYGLRASNGVIIITTKKGKEGKPQVAYNANVSASTPMKYMDVLSGDEVRTLASELSARSYPGVNATSMARLGTENTDWQKEIFRTAISNDHNLSVAGTYKNLPYRVSYGFTGQEGILRNTNFVRNSLNVNLTPTFLDGDLKIAFTAKAMNTHQNFGSEGAIGTAVAFDPTQPVRNGNSLWGGYFTWTSTADNLPNGKMNPDGVPISLATANPVALVEQTDNTSVVNRGLVSVQADYRLKFLRELKLTLNAGIDYSSGKGHDDAPNNAASRFGTGPGRKVDYTGVNQSRLLDLYANYSKAIGRSNLDVTVGHSYQSFARDGSRFERNGDETVFTDSQLGDDGTTNEPREYVANPNYLLSFFGRVNYTFADKYLITLSARDDASSRFSKENRWIIFPAAAFAWRINKEGFLSGASAVSDLKVRVSYGKTGQQEVATNPYPYLSTYQRSNATAQYQFGNTFYTTLRPQAYDANLRWETTTQLDAGIDFGFLSNRLTGTVDVYRRQTEDLINQVPLAAGTNFSNFVVTNVGDLENKGFEITVKADIIKKQDFEWSFGANFSSNENKVTKLLLIDNPNYVLNLGGIGLQRFIQGAQPSQPIYFFNVFQQVYNSDGMPIEALYVDRRGSGITGDELNKYPLHKAQPNQIFGVNTRVNYKQWDLYLSGRANIGNYVYNQVAANAYHDNFFYPVGYFNNLPAYINDSKFDAWQGYSDFYIQNASFFKMDNISLGYSFNEFLSQKLKARMGFTLQNAFFVTKYKGIDPELANGIDNNIYPRPRVFMFSLNVTY